MEKSVWGSILLLPDMGEKTVGFDGAGEIVPNPVKTGWANQGGIFACL
ncbi:MAG: hypothetical protein WAT68_00695 [Candidatus Nitrotoga sp.]